MKLEINGRASCGQKSRHIDIRYFFMKDRVKTENITIMYCPTEEMLADFFTKPLQGALFDKFKAVLMGRSHLRTLRASPLAPAEERVDRTTKTTKSEQNKTSTSSVNVPIENEYSTPSETPINQGTWTVVQKDRRKMKVRELGNTAENSTPVTGKPE
jgi:hypothetical protein